MLMQSDSWRRGRRAAIEGYSMDAPTDIRRKTDRDAFNEGWMAGKKEARQAIEGKRVARFADRVAHPVAALAPDQSLCVLWRDESRGKVYSSWQAALQALIQDKLDSDELDAWLASTKAKAAAKRIHA